MLLSQKLCGQAQAVDSYYSIASIATHCIWSALCANCGQQAKHGPVAPASCNVGFSFFKLASSKMSTPCTGTCALTWWMGQGCRRPGAC